MIFSIGELTDSRWKASNWTHQIEKKKCSLNATISIKKLPIKIISIIIYLFQNIITINNIINSHSKYSP